jgi:hypothetical protein
MLIKMHFKLIALDSPPEEAPKSSKKKPSSKKKQEDDDDIIDLLDDRDKRKKPTTAKKIPAKTPASRKTKKIIEAVKLPPTLKLIFPRPPPPLKIIPKS